jgi:hypothetical protein
MFSPEEGCEYNYSNLRLVDTVCVHQVCKSRGTQGLPTRLDVYKFTALIAEQNGKHFCGILITVFFVCQRSVCAMVWTFMYVWV